MIKPKTIIKRRLFFKPVALQKTLQLAKEEIHRNEEKIINSLTPAEEQFYLKAKENDYLIIRGGWPDFMIIKGDKISFVEIKDKTDKLTTKQKIMLNILSDLGFSCFVWKPDKGFIKYKK